MAIHSDVDDLRRRGRLYYQSSGGTIRLDWTFGDAPGWHCVEHRLRVRHPCPYHERTQQEPAERTERVGAHAQEYVGRIAHRLRRRQFRQRHYRAPFSALARGWHLYRRQLATVLANRLDRRDVVHCDGPLGLRAERRQPDLPLRAFLICLSRHTASAIHRRNGSACVAREEELSKSTGRKIQHTKSAGIRRTPKASPVSLRVRNSRSVWSAAYSVAFPYRACLRILETLNMRSTGINIPAARRDRCVRSSLVEL